MVGEAYAKPYGQGRIVAVELARAGAGLLHSGLRWKSEAKASLREGLEGLGKLQRFNQKKGCPHMGAVLFA